MIVGNKNVDIEISARTLPSLQGAPSNDRQYVGYTGIESGCLQYLVMRCQFLFVNNIGMILTKCGQQMVQHLMMFTTFIHLGFQYEDKW